jgi:hypothetical protein
MPTASRASPGHRHHLEQVALHELRRGEALPLGRGYRGPSAFIESFRLAFGATPGRCQSL